MIFDTFTFVGIFAVPIVVAIMIAVEYLSHINQG